MGIEGTVLGEMTADAYSISDDADYAGSTTRTHGAAGWNCAGPGSRPKPGAAHRSSNPWCSFSSPPLTPKACRTRNSALVEFDEGNVFALDRFPGSDAVERGPRANVGVSWTRFDPQGWSMGVTLGRVFREADLGQFGRIGPRRRAV